MATRRKTTSRKKEIFMGLKLKVGRATPPATAGRSRSTKVKLPVFEDQKGKVVQKIMESIEDANGRYGSPEQEANPLPKPIRSKCWTVRTKSDELLEEQCEVTLRVGQGLWDCFEEDPHYKESTRRYLVDADMLVPVLQELRKMVEGLDKSSPEGKSFHALAIEAAGRRAKGKYNKATDMFE